MASSSFTYVPKYFWNDDERDTKHHISYYENNDTNEYEYIPSFKIMKEYYDEETNAYSCYSEVDSDTESFYDTFGDSFIDNSFDNYTFAQYHDDTCDDCEGNLEQNQDTDIDVTNNITIINTNEDGITTEDGLNNNTTFNKYIYT